MRRIRWLSLWCFTETEPMIGEHSYSRPQMPVAEGRPDARDLEEAVRFGENVSGRIGLYCGSVLPERLKVRGCRPYKIKGAQSFQSPEWHEDLCSGCGICGSVCPVGAVTFSSGIVTADKNICTKCCSCVKNCPSGALTFETPFTEYLYRNFSRRMNPEIFLPD